MLYTVCLWSVCACVCVSEIPSWFKSIVFGKAVCCAPLRIGALTVDVSILFLFSQMIVLTGLWNMRSFFFFSDLYFLSNNLVIN